MAKKLVLVCLLFICPLAKSYQYNLVFFDTRPEVLDHVHAKIFYLNGQWYFSSPYDLYRVWYFYFTSNRRTPYAMVVAILDSHNQSYIIYADIQRTSTEVEAGSNSTFVPAAPEECQ